jgi:cell division protein FtsN
MKTTIKLIFLGIIMAFYAGCNSATYEIIEVEEVVDIKPEKSTISDIKEEPTTTENSVSENKVNDNKFTDKQMTAKIFAIQIGAFNREDNASSFTDKAKNKLAGEDVSYKNVEGLYKVRLGSFNNVSDAAALLQIIQQKGFTDSFIVELTYYKVENK